MQLRLDLRHLLLASWPVDRDAVSKALPLPLVPTVIDGEHLVTVAAFRCVGGRLGRVPVLPFSQLNVRVYAQYEGEQAVFFVRSLVTAGGLGGFFLGAPYKLAWLRVRPGELRASGLGVRLRYRIGSAEATPGQLGRHELGIFEERGVRAFRVRRGPAEWQAPRWSSPRAWISCSRSASASRAIRSSSTRRRRLSRPTCRPGS